MSEIGLKKTWENSNKDFWLIIGQSIWTYGQFHDVLIDIEICQYLCNIQIMISSRHEYDSYSNLPESLTLDTNLTYGKYLPAKSIYGLKQFLNSSIWPIFYMKLVYPKTKGLCSIIGIIEYGREMCKSWIQKNEVIEILIAAWALCILETCIGNIKLMVKIRYNKCRMTGSETLTQGAFWVKA